MIKHKAYFDAATHTVTYLVWDADTSKAVIIDPVMDYEPNAATLESESVDRVLADADDLSLDLEWVLDTHAHADHISGAHYVREKRGTPIGIGAKITEVQKQFKPLFMAADVATDGGQFDRLFDDGDEVPLGSSSIKIMHTPGHTPACVTYLIGDFAFVGDTLFMPDYGTARTDFPGGDAATLYQSIQRILSLPDTTKIMVGHDYLPEGRNEYVWQTTVADEKSRNIHIGGNISEADFVKMRESRDATLCAPKLILPSLQVNIRAGALPPKAVDGHHYLTIPINRV